jgi:hypothetical protein
MRDRCINGNHKSAIHYKDAGISIAAEWDLFANFEAWALANGYEEHLTIDRKDITKWYSCDNCEWITRAENTKRQGQDYHGNHKAVKAFNESQVLTFRSTADCAKYIIANNLSKSTNPDSVATIIGAITNKRYKSDKAYGFYFTEAK